MLAPKILTNYLRPGRPADEHEAIGGGKAPSEFFALLVPLARISASLDGPHPRVGNATMAKIFWILLAGAASPLFA
jgi:hypothetical protein